MHQGLPGNHHTRDVIAGELFGEDEAAVDQTAAGGGREASDRAPYETPKRRDERETDFYEPENDDPPTGADILTGPAAEE